jgi:hypothetical protein
MIRRQTHDMNTCGLGERGLIDLQKKVSDAMLLFKFFIGRASCIYTYTYLPYEDP